MVKTRVLFLVGCLIVLAGCGLLRRAEKANPEVLQIATGRLGGEVSLVRAAQNLVAVYSSWETTGLYAVTIALSDHLPPVAPTARMIDKIDMAPPLASSFGEQAAISNGDAVTVMYLARAAEDKMVLKVASLYPGAQAWTLDALQPTGNPVAMLPAGPDRLDLFWAAGALLHMSYPNGAQAESLVDPFTSTRRAAIFFADGNQGGDSVSGGAPAPSRRGMTVYDTVSRSLFAFFWNGFEYTRVKIDGAGPVHSSLLLPDGHLAVLSWDSTTQRLELLVQSQEDSRISRTLVTMSENTTAAVVLPPGAWALPQSRVESRTDRLLFLYNDARRLGGGRLLHELALLAPGSGWGPGVRKYHRIILTSGPDPVADFSALEVGGMLYVLVLQDGLKLLKLPLPG